MFFPGNQSQYGDIRLPAIIEVNKKKSSDDNLSHFGIMLTASRLDQLLCHENEYLLLLPYNGVVDNLYLLHIGPYAI